MRVPWLAVALLVAVCSCVTYAVALSLGPSCADRFALPAAVAFIPSFLWVAYLLEKRKGSRR